ncbi:GNAT family N-acetyltransferase [Ignavigranum ruoffiae]|uniref:GNAT family N-acetyltransferase n=2 Tax=Ignavigranum ruoffiae TaxID=89093 RepID=UPI002877F0E3|nr:GNAT family N-acetyltransferase [Ignavigranum ruoffiae]
MVNLYQEYRSLISWIEREPISFSVYEDQKLIALLRAVRDGQTIVFIQDLLVDPVYQGQGIGRALIQRVIEKYKDVYQIHLLTDRSSHQANAFYRAMNFTPVSEVDCIAYIYVKQ